MSRSLAVHANDGSRAYRVDRWMTHEQTICPCLGEARGRYTFMAEGE